MTRMECIKKSQPCGAALALGIPGEQLTAKQCWVHCYAIRIFDSWMGRQSRGQAPRDCVRKIERDLSVLYDDPLKRLLIECSY